MLYADDRCCRLRAYQDQCAVLAWDQSLPDEAFPKLQQALPPNRQYCPTTSTSWQVHRVPSLGASESKAASAPENMVSPPAQTSHSSDAQLHATAPDAAPGPLQPEPCRP